MGLDGSLSLHLRLLLASKRFFLSSSRRSAMVHFFASFTLSPRRPDEGREAERYRGKKKKKETTLRKRGAAAPGKETKRKKQHKSKKKKRKQNKDELWMTEHSCFFLWFSCVSLDSSSSCGGEEGRRG